MVTNSFNVLDRRLDLRQSHLLEASAGTGKTYSIENIVVRLLLEKNPVPLEKILVVTFTRAATSELKQRIRASIQKTLNDLKTESSTPGSLSLPDFLSAICEEGDASIIASRRALERALFGFDQAQIFTIHGFCSRMLKENPFDCDVGFNLSDEVEKLPKAKVLGLVRDFFRTAIRSENYSRSQLKRVLKKYKNQIDSLEQALCKTITQGIQVAPGENFESSLKKFLEIMRRLKQKGYCSQGIVDDFLNQAPLYKETCNSQGQVHEYLYKSIQKFAQLFDQDHWTSADFELLIEEGIQYLEALDPLKLKKRVGKQMENSSPLHYPELLLDLKKELYPLVSKARDPMVIYAQMAYECQQLFIRFSGEEEWISPDAILQTMWKGLENPSFVHAVRFKYRAVIVDEFQDTDPIQWGIFQKLFSDSSANCTLYLVGDPKQSIYAFRQADIYTYLSAGKTIDKKYHVSLGTNYRSQPSLVNALNALFKSDNAPGLIDLPKMNNHLSYQEVMASSKNAPKDFQDGLGAVHFCSATGKLGRGKAWPSEELESDFFFPFICQEIQRLTSKNGLTFSQCAVLVRDRFQAERFAIYCRQWNIPTMTQQRSQLNESPMVQAFRECVRAVLHPRDLSAVKMALGGPLIGFTHHDLLLISENFLQKLQYLRKVFLTSGFTSFFQHLMESSWLETGQSVAQTILSREFGLEMYRDLHQLAEFVSEQQIQFQLSPEAVLNLLDHFQALNEENERLKLRKDPTEEGVQVLTLHMSKGLEFDVVFALGLTNRLAEREELFPIQNQNQLQLAAWEEKHDTAYQLYLRENDAEKIRQLYVAMTRAKYRLYVPIAIAEDQPHVSFGCASPMDLFLAKFRRPVADYRELYERIQQENGKVLKEWIDEQDSLISITYQDLQKRNFTLSLKHSEKIVELTPPPSSLVVPGVPKMIHSFTGISRLVHPKEIGEISIQQEKPLESPQLYFREDKTIHTLPAGAETGNLLHLLFETLRFADFREMVHFEECLPFILPLLEGSPFKEWASVLAKIVFDVLKTPLIDGMCLCDIEKSRAYTEMEFLYPYQGEKWNIPEEMSLENHFLKGYIDLFFLYQGKYYLVDWKSNWLDENEQGYHRENLEQAMRAHNYHLQAAIYYEAIKRYLKNVDPRPIEECFGGIYYLFLRGINSLNPQNGVYRVVV